jgi:predicted transcriptional regulator
LITVLTVIKNSLYKYLGGEKLAVFIEFKKRRSFGLGMTGRQANENFGTHPIHLLDR